MSDINSILYCNEELCEDDDNKQQQNENGNPLFEMYNYNIIIIIQIILSSFITFISIFQWSFGNQDK